MTFQDILSFFLFILKIINIVDAHLGCVGEGNIWPPNSQCNQRQYGMPIMFKVICNGLKSTELLNVLPRNLGKLVIKRSTFEILDGSIFKNCSTLTELTLKDNKLKTFKVDLLHNLSIETLVLTNNSKFDLSRDTNLFSALGQSLQRLTILNGKDIPQEMFEPLIKLNALTLDQSATKGKLGKSFSKLYSLTTLSLRHFSGDLSEDTFQYVNKCTTLKLVWTNIRSIHNKTFSALPNLTCLDLSYNMFMNLASILPPLHAASQKLQNLTIRYLNGAGIPTSKVDDSFFKVFSSKPNLTRLSLDKNEILHMRWSIKYTPKKLKYLDISYNRLSNLFYLISESFLMSSLEELNFSYQAIRYSVKDYEDKYQLDDNTTDADLEKEFNTISENEGNDDFEEFIEANCKANDNIACTFPKNIDAGDLNNDNWCIPCPRKVKIFIADGSIVTNIKNLPTILLLGNCSVEEIRLRHNRFVNCGGQLMMDRPKGNKPLLIDFSFNLMACLSPDIFNFSISRNLIIGTLLLEGNSLCEQLSKDEGGRTFERYEHLIELNLSDNKIKRLPKDIFKNLRRLETLNLSRNSLQVLKFDVTRLLKLRMLDISQNLFVALDGYQQTIISMMSKSRGYQNFIVDLYGNPIQCSCETIGFLTWITSGNTKIKDFERLTCLYLDNLVNLTKTNAIRTQLILFCYASLPLQIVGCLLALTIVCALVGYVFYKYRWDVRYYLLKRAQWKRERNLSIKSKFNDYNYDAFVCYNEGDTLWVVQELIKNLESPDFNSNYSEMSTEDQEASVCCGSSSSSSSSSSSGGGGGGSLENRTARRRRINPNDKTDILNADLRLCIHERDFEPGREIEKNILTAIENSRRVIVVISNNFLKSRWCPLELEMAKMESLVRGVNLIVAVFLEPIEDVTKNLEWLTKYYTYLEWFRYDYYRRHEFWRRLRVALGTGKNRRELNLQCTRNGVLFEQY